MRKLAKKIKEKVKKIVSRRKKVSPAKPQKTSYFRKEEILGTQETHVEKTKYYTPPITETIPKRQSAILLQDLPNEYGKDRIVLQVRDPWWIHTYWELTNSTLERVKNELKDDFYKGSRALRVYDVTNIIFDGTNANRYFDISINDYANNWYIDTAGPGRSWCVDLGIKLPDGRFITILRSNVVHTPLDIPSWITDEEWMVPEEVFARLYGMGFGFGRSSPVGKAWQERFKRALFSGALASPGMASMASPVKKLAKERKFWLVVNTELIVYGATEPDAKVTVQDRPVNLRPDGTFSLRFALPDGKQIIPVKAVSSDGEEERIITPIVTKETR